MFSCLLHNLAHLGHVFMSCCLFHCSVTIHSDGHFFMGTHCFPLLCFLTITVTMDFFRSCMLPDFSSVLCRWACFSATFFQLPFRYHYFHSLYNTALFLVLVILLFYNLFTLFPKYQLSVTSIPYRYFYITVTFTLPLFVGGTFHRSVYLFSSPLLLHFLCL